MSLTLDLRAIPMPAGAARGAGRRWARRACALLGHEVDNRTAARDASGPRCSRCGEPCLHGDGSATHTRHVLACAVKHHTYARTGRRHRHNEYTCLRCGHTLLFEASRDPYARESVIPKKLSYTCALFGHRVHTVGERNGLTEYACECGHPFLLAQREMARVTHPLTFVASGHLITFVERRGGFSEHRCLRCGHTFAVASAA